MTEFLELKVDKFTFHVATDRWYNPTGVWAIWDGMQVQIGLSDYLQQRSGDVAFAEVKPPLAKVIQGEEVAVIETIKVNISLPSPVTGQVISINEALQTTPEIINQDPYGAGWLAILSVRDFSAQAQQLLEASAYYEIIKHEAEQETRNS